MGAQAAELSFLLKMRDEASRVFKSFTDNVGKGGGEAGKAGKQFDDLGKKAKDAASAIAGAFAAKTAFGSSLAQFRQYDLGLTNIVKTTDMAGKQLDDFTSKFDQLASRMKGVSTQTLQEIAASAGQMGVQGTQNILDFTETLGKLAVTSDLVGEQGAKSIMRLLTITGEGVTQIKTFGDVINTLGNTTAASEAEIVRMSAAIAASTSQFKLGSTAIAGLGAAAAQLDLQPELFGTAMSRALTKLSEAAQYGSKGMEMFSRATGMSRQEFQRLLKDNPTAAFQKFLYVLQAVSADGQTLTGVLKEFGLEGEESIKVFGTAAQQAQLFAEKVKQANESAANPGALDKEYSTFAKALDSEIKGLSNSFGLLQKEIGKALAPLAKLAINAAKAFSDIARAAIAWMPNWLATTTVTVAAVLAVLKTVLLAMSVFGTTSAGAIAVAIAAFSKLGTAISVLATVLRLGLLVSLNLVVGFLQGFAAAFVATFGAIPLLIAAAVAAIALLGAVIYKNWEAIKAFFAQSWSDIGSQLVDTIVNAFNKAMAKAKDIWTEFWDWTSSKEVDVSGGAKAMAAARKGERTLTTNGKIVDPSINQGEVQGWNGLSDAQRQVLENLDDIRKKTKEVEDAQRALEKLKTITSGSDARSQAEINRLEAQLELRKRELDPAKDRLRLLDIEIESAKAITQEQKNRLEIEQNIRDITEKIGQLTAEQTKSIKERTQQLQAARQGAAFSDMQRALQVELDNANALTQAQRNRLEIIQKIYEFEKANGNLTAEQARELTKLMQDRQRAQQTLAVLDKTDPTSSAKRTYADDIASLKQAGLSAEEYRRRLEVLNQTSLAQRDPFKAQTQSIQDQINLLKIGGDYREADRKTVEAILALQRQGVQVDQQRIQGMLQLNRQLQDAQKAENSGIKGWMNGVGSVKDNLMDLQKDFASGLSSAISGALQGNKDAFRNFFQTLGGKAIDMAVNQLLKNAFSNLGFGDTTDPMANLNKALASGISTTTAIVNAGTVAINGTGVSGGTVGAINGTNGVTKGAWAGSAVNPANSNFKDAYLDAVMKYESGGRNIHQNIVPSGGGYNPSTGTVTGPSSAQGYFQITNSTWKDISKTAGIDLKQYPTAMSAPYDVQRQAASSLYDTRGTAPWSPYNANLRNWEANNKGGANDNAMPKVDTTQLTQASQQMQQVSAQTAQALDQAKTSFASLDPTLDGAAQSVQMAGANASTAGPQFDQAGSQIQQAGQKAATGGAQAATSVPGIDDFSKGLTQIGTSALSAIPGIGGLASGIMSLLNSLLSSSGGLGGLLSGGLKLLGIGAATGGYITGPGTTTSDSIPAMLSNKEFVVNAEATKKYLPLLSAINSNKVPHFAVGGLVDEKALASVDNGGAMMRREASSGSGQVINRVNSTFAPSIPITVQPSGNKETDSKMVESMRAELDTLLDNKMAAFAEQEQRSGGMLNQKSRWR